jgi:tRNA synthetases class I (I, L, M and V)
LLVYVWNLDRRVWEWVCIAVQHHCSTSTKSFFPYVGGAGAVSAVDAAFLICCCCFCCFCRFCRRRRCRRRHPPLLVPQDYQSIQGKMATADTKQPPKTGKRDALRANEIEVQKQWEDAKVFEADVDSTKEHFLVTFPYPYSNGHLHLGHAFSLTKAVFRAQFERHMGKNVLFPFAFHCTGMPIQAVRGGRRRVISTLDLFGHFHLTSVALEISILFFLTYSGCE